MQKILVKAEKIDDSFRLVIPSEYNRILMRKLVKEDGIELFELRPRVRGSRKQRGYLEGAVIWVWAKWQYGLDPRNPETHEQARYLFKQHFLFDVVQDRKGNPRRVPQSLSGKHAEALETYTNWAQENGAPIPNEQLYKLWRDQYSMEPKWEHYWDWLEYLGLEHDAHPSKETIAEKLKL